MLAATLLRWRRLPPRARAIGLAAACAFAVYGSGVVQPPDLERTMRQAGETLGPGAYLLVGLLAFLETAAAIGLIAPGELAVIVGGVTAGQGHTDIVLLIIAVWACAHAGDITSYVVGRRLGPGFIRKHGPSLRLTVEHIERVERYFAQHGGKTIILGRFVGFVRPLAPVIAGASGMPPGRFVPFAFVAAGLWSATFCLLGYFFWQSLDQVAAIAEQGTLALGGGIAVLVVSIGLYRRLRRREQAGDRGQREDHEDHDERGARRDLRHVVRLRVGEMEDELRADEREDRRQTS